MPTTGLMLSATTSEFDQRNIDDGMEKTLRRQNSINERSTTKIASSRPKIRAQSVRTAYVTAADRYPK